MRALVDYNSRVMMGVASEEQETAFEKAKSEGKNFFTLYLAGCPHKLVVEHRPDPIKRLMANPSPPPLFFDETKHAPPVSVTSKAEYWR